MRLRYLRARPQICQMAKPVATIVFSGGCFWGIEGVFEHVKGVKEAVSGYAGGSKMTAHYEIVSGGGTGHAESVKVTHDPSQGFLRQIVAGVFFSGARSHLGN